MRVCSDYIAVPYAYVHYVTDNTHSGVKQKQWCRRHSLYSVWNGTLSQLTIS